MVAVRCHMCCLSRVFVENLTAFNGGIWRRIHYLLSVIASTTVVVTQGDLGKRKRRRHTVQRYGISLGVRVGDLV